MEKGCFGAYFANTSGFSDELEEIEEYLNDHKDQDSLAEEVSGMIEEDPEDESEEGDNRSFIDKMKDMGSAAVKAVKDKARKCS